MCGITGYINKNLKPIRDSETIISMLKVQKHRGPDDSGIKFFSLESGKSVNVGFEKPEHVIDRFEGVLGFNRLSILDLSMNGHQPMTSPDGKVILTLNGEIYNAFSYKTELEEWGYRFSGTSDTEVVLAMFLKYGFIGMLEKLNGMFAIAIVDLGNKELYITRDRFGIKPMYYISNGDILAFSSELKSFRFLEDFSFRLKEAQIDEYLIFRNHLEGTLFEEVHSLKPGHYLFYNHSHGVSIREYFNINKYSRGKNLITDINLSEEKLEEWLGESVKSQLMSDVKLGCQLSGGIDSSIVTWLANRNSLDGNFEAVSIVFQDPRFNEEKFVDKVSADLGIKSHKFMLDSDYYFRNIVKAAWHLESPINHPNTVAIYRLSQCARKHVTVLLSGEGADEVFGGYDRFYELSYPFKPRKIYHILRNGLNNLSETRHYFSEDYRAIMATAFMSPFRATNLYRNFSRERALGRRLSLYNSLSGSLFEKQVKYEILSYLPDLLLRQDKMSMAHSIENRVPFLDNEVVEKSFTISEKLLLLRKSPEGHNTEKYLLKKLASRKFGNAFAFRNKMSFGIPVRDFLGNPGFSEYMNDEILPGIKKRGIFNFEIVSNLVKELGGLRYHDLEALWVIIAFEIWASVYLDNNYENWNS